MPVTDYQVATLRAHLAKDRAEYKRLFSQLDRAAAAKTYPALITGAFFEAVSRNLARQTSKEQVIDFVRDLRARYDYDGDRIDPYAAEQLILTALGHDSDAGKLSDESSIDTQMLLLTGLVYEAGYDDTQLDEFMAKARANADYMLKKREERKHTDAGNG